MIAFAEFNCRLQEVIYTPFYPLFIVGPAALLAEESIKGRN